VSENLPLSYFLINILNDPSLYITKNYIEGIFMNNDIGVPNINVTIPRTKYYEEYYNERKS